MAFEDFVKFISTKQQTSVGLKKSEGGPGEKIELDQEKKLSKKKSVSNEMIPIV